MRDQSDLVTVNLAALLEAGACPGDIMVSSMNMSGAFENVFEGCRHSSAPLFQITGDREVEHDLLHGPRSTGTQKLSHREREHPLNKRE